MAHYQQKKDKTGRRETALGMETGERDRGREVETDQSPEILDRRKTDKHPHTPLETHCEGEKTWSTCDCHSVASLSQWMVSGGITEPVTIQMVSLRRWLPAGGFTGQWVPAGDITKQVGAYWWYHQAGECLLASAYWLSAYWWYHQAGECLLAVSPSWWVPTGGFTGQWVPTSLSQQVATGGVSE